MTVQTSIIAVVGPTAAGKSDLAVELALRTGGEVVSVDSMQIYRGMDIGTAKLTPAEQRGVPHHLLDMLDVTEPATVADFQRWARSAIDDCHRRGSLPVVVGGSALYLRAVLDDFDFPGTDPEVRARLEDELAQLGTAAMHARLASHDGVAAAAILATNGRRIVRALEVMEITGQPFRSSLPEHTFVYDGVVQIGLAVPPDVLDDRIERRVRRMWSAGFVDEVRALRGQGLATGRTASRALGYRQVLAFLAGECTEDEALTATVVATRRFARRQDRWFRRDPRIHWLAHDDDRLVDLAVQLVHGETPAAGEPESHAGRTLQ